MDANVSSQHADPSGPRRFPARGTAVALAVLATGIVLSGGLFIKLRHKQSESIADEFQRAVHNEASAFRRTIDVDFLVLESIQAFHAASQGVERSEFNEFVKPFLRRHADLRAVQWVPWVRDSDRARHEAETALDGSPGYQIVDRVGGKDRQRAPRRESYFPICRVESAAANEVLLGLDLAVSAEFRRVAERSCDTGETLLTSAPILSPKEENRAIVRFVAPVYRNGVSPGTVQERREHLEGFVIVVTAAADLLEESRGGLVPDGLDFYLASRLEAGGQRPLTFCPSRTRQAADPAVEPWQLTQAADLCHTEDLDLPGERWSLTCAAAPAFFSNRSTWEPWAGLACGLLLTLLVETYVVGAGFRQARAEQIASQLAEANRELGREMGDRQQAEQRQARLLWRLEAVNRLQEDLLQPDSLETQFHKITAMAVDLLDLDFCRVWMTRPGDLCDRGCVHAAAADEVHACRRRDACLHLMASSGRYTHTDGGHRRVPLGCYKIGRIASGEDRRFLTNCVTTDPRVHDHAWAEQIGLTSFAGYKLRDFQGRPVGVLAMFAKHPISEEEDAFLSNLAETTSRVITRNQAEEELRQADEGARRENAKLTAMISGMEEGIVFADSGNVIVEINEYLCRFVGKSRGELLGKRIEDIHTGKALDGILRQIGRFRSEPGAGAFVLQRRLGDAEVILRMQPIYRDGRYDGVLLNVIDVSGLVKARRQAEAATRAKSQFLANMSHEIRTPLTAVLGYADLLTDPDLSPGTRNEYLVVVRRSGEHLLELINDILDLSKIEAGKLAIEVQRCNVVSLVADVASLMRPRAEQCGIHLIVEYPGAVPETILSDEARLRQSLVNLVGNAVKFTERGEVRVVVSFLPAWRDGRPALKFDVADTGIGIRPEVLAELFQPFTQGDATTVRKFGGTGLGLAISRHLAELLGGELTAASVAGQGSTFTLVLPTGDLDGVRMLDRPAEVLQDAPDDSWRPTSEDLHGIRVLLAEDGVDNQELISLVLRKAGAEVEIAKNGRIAVEKAEAGRFDAVLMDMNMPEMDGYEATRILRDQGFPTPILALTANAMAGDRQRCLDAGCNDYVAKPIDRLRLIGVIAQYAGRTTSEVPPTPAPTDDHPPPVSGPIVSQYAADPDMAAILDGFVTRLPDQVDAMRRTLDQGAYEDLQRAAHKLKGSGGSYGYASLTEASRTLENAAKARDGEAALAAIERILELCGAIQEGYTASVPSAEPVP